MRLKAFVERQHRNGLSDVTFVDQHQVRELAPGIAPHVIAVALARPMATPIRF